MEERERERDRGRDKEREEREREEREATYISVAQCCISESLFANGGEEITAEVLTTRGACSMCWKHLHRKNEHPS